MSELARATKLYQSNLKSVQSLQSQLSKLQTKLDTYTSHKQLTNKNQALRDKSSQLSDQLIGLQLMRGHWHVPIPDAGPSNTAIVFPQKRACDVSQSESEPSPKLDKRDPTKNSSSSLVLNGSRPTGDKPAAPKGKGRGAEKGRGGEKTKGASKPPEEEVPDISRMDFRIGKVLEVTDLLLSNILSQTLLTFLYSIQVTKHPNADTLFIEKINCGDPDGRVRQVVSGLVGKIPIEEIQDRIIIGEYPNPLILLLVLKWNSLYSLVDADNENSETI